MKYDNQYYFLVENGQSGCYWLKETEKSFDGLWLFKLESIKPMVRRRGHVSLKYGDDGKFSPSDFHDVSPSGVISSKFRDVLLSLNLPGIDFYPTDIENDGKVWTEHYFLHIWQNHRVLHQGRSQIDGVWEEDEFTLESLSLDEKVLDKLPLQQRLVFTLTEDTKFLYHQSVVDVLEASGLTGVQFLPITHWGIGSAFENSDDDLSALFDDL